MISVVIPCLNEAENLPNLLQRLSKAFSTKSVRVEIVIVDDASEDNTQEVLELQRRLLPETTIVYLRNTLNVGIYESWKIGVAAASFDLIAFMDGDLQNQPEDLVLMLDMYHRNPCHAVQGVRINIDNEDRLRTFLSRSFGKLLRIISALELSDPKSGFILCERDALVATLPSMSFFKHPQSFIGLGLTWQGYTLEQIPTRFDKRTAGSSFLESKLIKTVIESLLDLIRAKIFNQAFKARNNHLENWSRSQTLRFNLYFLTMPLHAWNIRRTTKHKLFHLLNTEKFSRTEWSVYQDKKLTAMLNHAHHNILWSKGRHLSAGPVSLYSKLNGYPLLEKSDLKELGPVPFMDLNHKYKKHRIATSGSTGSPLIIFADSEQLEWRFASTLRALMWTGWRMGDRQYRLWHQKIGMTRAQVVKEKLDAFLLRRTFVPAFEFDDKKVQALMNEIGQKKPFIVDGYAESLDYLTKVTPSSTHGGLPRIPAIMSSAQTLTTQTRSALEHHFNAKVYDKYGSREFSGIAYQCGFGLSFHVMSDSYIVEILVDGVTPATPGQVGEVVVTDLNNRLFPMIRYRIGDLATAIDPNEDCDCGRKMPKIGNIVGRTAALIITPKNRVLPGTFFAHFFKDYELIVFQYQVIQEDRDSILLKVVKGRSFSSEGFERLLHTLNDFLDNLRVDIEFVDGIPLGRTGKRSPVVSMLNH